jgi:hypothetical protein
MVEHDHSREEVGGQPDVVQDRDDGGAVALVEVGEEIHDLDLVAKVEMDGRLVEGEHGGRLRDRHREQHELALPLRQLPGIAPEQVADADPVDRRRDGGTVRWS